MLGFAVLRFVLRFTFIVVLVAVFAVSSLRAENIGGDVSASFPEAGAQALTGALAGATVEPSSGVFQASLPIALPSARGASQPSLTLTYSSTAGIREAGVGWGLALPAITRSIRRGPPRLDDEWKHPSNTGSPDELLFNGERLVPICEVGSTTAPCNLGAEPLPGWANPGTRYYRLEIDNHARFFLAPNRLTWRIQFRGGEIFELGRPQATTLVDGDPDASIDYDEITKPKKPYPRKTIVTARLPFRWNLVSRFHWAPSGGSPNNVVHYRWAKLGTTGRGYLTDVYYSPPVREGYRTDGRFTPNSFAHHVHLRWEFIPQAGNRFTPVWKATPDFTLARIDVASKPYEDAAAPREMVRRYHLRYRGNQRAYLTSFQLEGRCPARVVEVNGVLPSSACPRMPATLLKWSEWEGNTTPGLLVTSPALPDPVPDGWRLIPLDINADSLPDLVENNPGFGPDEDQAFNYFGAFAPVTRRAYVQGSAFLDETTLESPAGLFSNAGYTLTGDYAGTGETGAIFYGPDATRYCHTFPEGPGYCDDPYVIIAGRAFKAQRLGTTTGISKWVWEPDLSSTPSILGKDNIYQVEAVGDVNGDGVPDLLDAHADPGDSGSIDEARIEIRYGARRSDTTAPYKSTTLSCVGPSRDMMRRSDWGLDAPLPIALADMNGDGLADLTLAGPQKVEYWPGDGRGNFSACRGTGCTCSELGVEAPSVTMFGSIGPTWSKGWRFADLNGDGYADAVAVGGDGVRVFFNIDGFAFADPIFIAGPSLFPTKWSEVQQDLDNLKISFADMNGNGITDLFFQVGREIQTIDLNRILLAGPSSADAFGPRPGLLIGIENGLGAKTEISYMTTAQLAQLALTLGKPWQERIPQVLQVVARITNTSNSPGAQPTRVWYKYEDPAWDGYERRFRGFREVTVTSSLTTTHTTFFIPPCPLRECWSSDPNFVISRAATGSPVITETYDANGHYLSTVSSSYQVMEVMQGVGGTPIKFAYPSQVDTRIYDTNDWNPTHTAITVDVRFGDLPPLWTKRSPVRSRAHELLRSTQVMDVYGNTVKSIDHGRIAEDTAPIDSPIIRSTVFAAPRPDWKFLPSVSTTDAFPARPRVPLDYPRTASYSYDSAGRLTEVKGYLTGTLALDRHHAEMKPIAPAPPGASSSNVWVSLARYDYDPYDNVVQFRGPNGRCQRLTYDTDFAQLIGSTADYRFACNSGPIATGQRWDRGMEVVTELTAPNGTKTRAAYDGLGRPTAVWRPDAGNTGQTQTEASTLVEYDDVPGGPVQRVKLTVTDNPGQSRAQWTYLDALGQTLLTLVQADPGAGDGGAWVVSGLPRLGVGNLISGLYSPWFYSGDPTNHPLTAPAGPVMAITRDSFGRVIEFKRLDGTMANRAVYRPLVVEHHDATSRSTRVALDGHGLQREWKGLTDGGYEVVIQTTYQVGGEPSRVLQWHTQGASGHFNRWMQYDSLGRLVLNAEPNTALGFVEDPAAATAMRAWRYAYNDEGKLVGTSDARGCGENIYYDKVSRLLAEDFSPCLSSHAAYTAPNITTGAGTESFYRYDTPEPGQTTGYGVPPANLIGRLVSKIDRATHIRYAYDWRGQQVGLLRRIAKASDAAGLWPEGATLADRFTDEWFGRSTQYDNAGRIVSFSTGAKTPELTEPIEGLSEISVGYSGRGLPQWVASTYGTLIEQASYEADGRPKTVLYGDAAHTLSKFTYDANRRLATRVISRTAPSLWTTGAPGYDPPAPEDLPTTQAILASFVYHYDAAGLLQGIEDKRLKTAWPAGARPVDTNYQYDTLGRLTRADYVRTTADPPTEFSAVTGAMPTATMPNRVGSQTFAFDFLGNIRSSTDDANALYDRSLGAQIHGDSIAGGPSQLRSAAGGAVAAHYDAAGNLVDLVIARPGPCSDAGGRCSHRLVYDWDELGRLARARRWDFTDVTADPSPYPALPTAGADAELRFRYGANGERVLRSAVAADGSQTHRIDVFDTLRLENAAYDEASASYAHTGNTEVAAVPGLARIVHRPDVPKFGGSDQHVLLQFSDHLNSTVTVIDHGTGELVQRTSYQAFGAPDSDYRPPRWGGLAALEGFTGKPDDAEVGLAYFGARYYQPNLGRWISPDPLTVHGLGSDLNAYAYVNGLPTMSVDADGLGLCPGVQCESGAQGQIPLWMRGQFTVEPPSFAIGIIAPPSTPAPAAPSVATPTVTPTPKDTGRWSGFMRFAVNAGPAGFALGLAMDPKRTMTTMVLDRLEMVESLLGEPNTTSDLSYTPAREAGSTGQPALSDTDQLLSITEQEITGAATGLAFRGALRGVVSLEARAALKEACPGGVCLREGACFIAGTLVATPEGERPIESLEIGDLVLSRDEKTGKQSARRVTRTFVTPDREVLELTLSAADGEERLVATLNHPFYVVGRGWTPASELDRGMSVATVTGAAIVRDVRRTEGRHTVYNLEVETTHTYFVGRSRSWVHNTCPTVYAGRTGPGPHADRDGWIPLRGPTRDWLPTEVSANNVNGYLYGCHSCGAWTPGTVSGNWVLDHQPPVALNPSGLIPFRGYPQCATCGLIRPGGTSQPFEIRRIIKWQK